MRTLIIIALLLVHVVLALKLARENALARPERYDHPDAAQRAFDLASTYGLVELGHLGLSGDLTRTVLTSGTTALVLLALFFLGGELIHGFATALLVGVVVGTYSSIYVASTAALALGRIDKSRAAQSAHAAAAG